MLTPEWRHRFNLYAAKGGKKSRRNTVARIERFIEYSKCRPEQVGKRHVYEFFEGNALSETTARDYWYALKHLWEMLGRDGEPPKPRSYRTPASPLESTPVLVPCSEPVPVDLDMPVEITD